MKEFKTRVNIVIEKANKVLFYPLHLMNANHIKMIEKHTATMSSLTTQLALLNRTEINYNQIKSRLKRINTDMERVGNEDNRIVADSDYKSRVTALTGTATLALLGLQIAGISLAVTAGPAVLTGGSIVAATGFLLNAGKNVVFINHHRNAIIKKSNTLMSHGKLTNEIKEHLSKFSTPKKLKLSDIAELNKLVEDQYLTHKNQREAVEAQYLTHKNLTEEEYKAIVEEYKAIEEEYKAIKATCEQLSESYNNYQNAKSGLKNSLFTALNFIAIGALGAVSTLVQPILLGTVVVCTCLAVAKMHNDVCDASNEFHNELIKYDNEEHKAQYYIQTCDQVTKNIENLENEGNTPQITALVEAIKNGEPYDEINQLKENLENSLNDEEKKISLDDACTFYTDAREKFKPAANTPSAMNSKEILPTAPTTRTTFTSGLDFNSKQLATATQEHRKSLDNKKEVSNSSTPEHGPGLTR